MISVRFQRGVELPDLGLWLDPHDRQPLAFMSHAHSDHLGAHAEVVVSRGTSALLKERLPGRRIEHILDFGQRLALGNFAITLLPAGHIFGSAQSFLETEAGTLLYTGDFKLRPSLSAERTEWRQADTLIMETTYGLPRYRMPPTEETIAHMVEFCREALAEGAVPVLLGYSLGKSQEILCALLAAGLTPLLHESVWRLTEIYREQCPGFPLGYERYDGPASVPGKVLICPPSASRSRMVRQFKQRRVAVLTGWALDSGAIYRYQCDAAFPLTDHADYPDLLRYVELVQPQRVLTLHGFAAEFARDLRERGVEAWALTGENQLELSLSHSPKRKTTSDESPVSAPIEPPTLDPASFAAFAAIGDRIGQTPSKLRKVEILSDYLRSLDSASLAPAAIYFSGRAFAQSDPRVLQTGSAIIRRSLLQVSGIGEAQFREISRTHADAGKTTFEALLGRTQPQPWNLVDSQSFFTDLAAARGPQAKSELLQRRLAELSPLEASMVVKILTGDLRLGLKESLVEEAIARAFAASIEEVREAGMLLGNLGDLATRAATGALASAGMTAFHPVKCMLASPEPSGEAIWARLAGLDFQAADAPAWAEDKYDGIRAQLHVAEGRVALFTRDLHDVTEQFGDLARAARTLPQQAIFDGEIIAFAAGRNLNFFDLQKRLGRKTDDDLFLGPSDIPVIFRAFDLLWLEGESLLRHPLRERRARLERLTLPASLEIAPRYPFTSATDLEAAFTAARQRHNEGLIIKDATSLYTPGRRGLAWLKFKKELATLDVVVIGAELGHGKRSQVLSDYTFAIRDDASGTLLTIGKAYSGLTDDEIEDLTAHFTATTLAQRGRYREVRPEIVLEIAFDSVQPSQRHNSGLALRFPRIKAIRRDKTPDDIDTLSFARSLVGLM